MAIAATIARLLLGVMFAVFGLNGFLHFIPAPLPAGPAGDFMRFLFSSHFYVPIFATQLVAGILLLTNQYVALAVALLAAVLANILTFHITMQPEGLPIALFATILWFVVAWSVRFEFTSLLARKPHAGLK
jgi:hypothetical protein